MLRHLTMRLVVRQFCTLPTKTISYSNNITKNVPKNIYRKPLLSYHRRYFSSELISTWPDGMKKFFQNEQITQPTEIQEKTLRYAMDNKNLVGVARTGSGKTLAFVIPAVIKILKSREDKKTLDEEEIMSEQEIEHNRNIYDTRNSSGPMSGPKCLVLAPTRELACQIHDVFHKFRKMNIKSIPLVGGASRSEQIRQLTRTPHDVYVATPGRLMDMLEAQFVDLSNVEYLVLDEADRMLDMGFEPQIRTIMKQIPENRQTLMWSATWPQEIQTLAAEFLKQYEYIAVDSENLKANPNIKQIVKVCAPHRKLDHLLEYLKEFKNHSEVPRVLIFVNTKRLADSLLLQLMRNRIRAISMHGGRSQKQRDDALRLFKDRRCNVLVATDVAARGLDISDITHVINYDMPRCIEDYIHRIGRTARHERSGTSVSFFTDMDGGLARKLTRVLKETQQDIPEELEAFSKNHHLYSSSSARSFRGQDNFYSSGGRYQSRNVGYSDSGYSNQRRRSDRYGRGFHDDDRAPRRESKYDEFDEEYNDHDRRPRSLDMDRFKASSIFQD